MNIGTLVRGDYSNDPLPHSPVRAPVKSRGCVRIRFRIQGLRGLRSKRPGVERFKARKECWELYGSNPPSIGMLGSQSHSDHGVCHRETPYIWVLAPSNLKPHLLYLHPKTLSPKPPYLFLLHPYLEARGNNLHVHAPFLLILHRWDLKP